MGKLIAQVATAVFVDGVRTIIQPGEALPRISKHDERELVQSGAAQHTGEQATLDEANATAVAAAEADFTEARERALDQESARQQANEEAAPAAASSASKAARKK